MKILSFPERLRSAFYAFPVLTLTLAGCRLGPDFSKPAAPGAAEVKLPDATAKGGQHFSPAQQIPGEWWKLFHSKELNALVEQAIRSNPDLQAAKASLKAAHAVTLAQRSDFLPQVNGSYERSRTKNSVQNLAPDAASGSPYYNLQTANLSVSYQLDLFGLNRRARESLLAQEEAGRFQTEGVYLTLASNVALAGIEQASLHKQLQIRQDAVTLAREQLQRMRDQVKLGNISAAEALAQETLLARMEQDIPSLQKQLEQQKNLVAALCGALPGKGPVVELDLDRLELPRELPQSLPSQIVAQRPDVRAAEAQLHSAAADVGVAVASRLPSLTLTGQMGSAADRFSQLARSSATFWEMAGNVAQPIFQGGKLLQQQRQAEALYEKADAQYRSVVVSSFQDVANVLQAIRADADAFHSAEAGEESARKSLAANMRQFELGDISHLDVIRAQQDYQDLRTNLETARAARFADTVAIYQALGGGWWNRSH